MNNISRIDLFTIELIVDNVVIFKNGIMVHINEIKKFYI